MNLKFSIGIFLNWSNINLLTLGWQVSRRLYCALQDICLNSHGFHPPPASGGLPDAFSACDKHKSLQIFQVSPRRQNLSLDKNSCIMRTKGKYMVLFSKIKLS